MNDRIALPSEAPRPGVSRRGLLAGALAGGAVAAVPSLATAGAAQAQTAAPLGSALTFFEDSTLNFQMLFVLGAVGYGAAETGEALATFDRIHARGNGYRVVFEEFQAEGRRLRKLADGHRRAGMKVSARSCYLRAAMYFDQALYFTLASAQPTRKHEGQLYREMESAWAHAAALFRPRFEPVRIPYGRTHLPGWLLTPPGARVRRPTVILNNGSDAQNIDMFVYGGAAAIERGWNALIFEGPGQGSNLFLRNKPFIPEWERVIEPVVDFLRRRPDVDRRRISLAGQSFGGYLVARAAAFEHRLAAVVPDPGVTDAFVSWQQNLPKSLLDLLYAGKRDEFDSIWANVLPNLPEAERFNIAKRVEIYGRGTFFDQLSLARKFVLTQRLARRIDAPVAALSPEGEQFFPGQAQKLYGWLREPKTLMRFTVAEGAQFHCEPMAPQLRNERVFDWLEDHARPIRRGG